MEDIGGIKVERTGSRLLTAEDVSEVTAHIERLESENASLEELVRDMYECFRIGAERDGVSKQWCYELFDTYTRKLRELEIASKFKAFVVLGDEDRS